MFSFLIDTSNLLYRGYYSYPNSLYGEVLFALTTIQKLLKDNPGSPVYLCLDGARKGDSLNTEYKANRDHGGINVYRYLPQLVYLVKDLTHVHIAYNPSLEADEVIFSLTRILDGKKVIISTDNDLLQSLREDTEILRKGIAINESYYKEEMFAKFHAVSPSRLPIYRAIVGDASDNLKPPVPRFPKELAASLAESIPYTGECPSKESFEDFARTLFDDASVSKLSKLYALIAQYDSFKTNFMIMKLDVYQDVFHPYLDDTPVIPNFPSSVIAMFKVLRDIDAGV